MHRNFLILDCSLLHICRNTFTHQKMLFLTLQISCRLFSKMHPVFPTILQRRHMLFSCIYGQSKMQTSEVFQIYYVWIPEVTNNPWISVASKNKISISLMQIIHSGLAGGPSLHYCFALEIVLILSFPRPKLTKWPHLILFGWGIQS